MAQIVNAFEYGAVRRQPGLRPGPDPRAGPQFPDRVAPVGKHEVLVDPSP